MQKNMLRGVFVRVLLALSALAAALPMLPAQAAPADPFTGASPSFTAPPEEAVHYNAGDWGVADQLGAATYTFAIPVPPGRNGMAPALALRYSSASPLRGGIAAGWTLHLPTIEQDYALGVDAGLRYKASLGSANGRLVPVADEIPIDDGDSAYRVDFDNSFTRFFRRRQGDFYSWTALTPDGVKHHFSKYLVNGPDPRWVIERQEDPFGNTVAYFWSSVQAPNGTETIDYSLDRIEYTSNVAAGLAAYAKVEFEYAPLEVCEGSNVPIGAALRPASLQVDGARRLTAIRTFVRDTPAADWRLSRQVSLGYALYNSVLYESDPVIDPGVAPGNLLDSACKQNPLRYLTQIDVAAYDPADAVTTLPPITFAYNRRVETTGPLPVPPSAHPMRKFELASPGYAQHGDSGRVRSGIQGDSLDIDGDGIRDRVAVVREDDLCKLVWRKGLLGGTFASEEYKSALPTAAWYAGWKGSPNAVSAAREGCTLNGQIAYRDYQLPTGPVAAKGVVSYYFLDYTGDGRLDLLTNVWATVCHWTYAPSPPRIGGDPCSFADTGAQVAPTAPQLDDEPLPGSTNFIAMTPEEAGGFSGPSGTGTHPYLWRVYPGTGDEDQLFRSQPIPVRSPMALPPSASDERLDTSAVVNISIAPLVDIDGDGFLDIVDTGDTFLTDCVNELLGHCDWTVYLGNGSGQFAETLDAYLWDVPSFGLGYGQGYDVQLDNCGLDYERIHTVYADLRDISGDGLPDLLVQDSAFALTAYLNRGGHFAGSALPLALNRPLLRTQTDCEVAGAGDLRDGRRGYLQRLVDLDSDGLLDLLTVGNGDPVTNIAGDYDLHAYFNVGNRFGPQTDLPAVWAPVKRLLVAQLAPATDNPFAGQWHIASDFTDVTGDGLADLAEWDGTTLTYITRPGLSTAPDRLAAVENGRGMRVEFRYAPSTDGEVVQWTGTAPALLPQVPWVVKQVTVEGGFDTPALTTDYRYQDPLYLSAQASTGVAEQSHFAGFSQTLATTAASAGPARRIRKEYSYLARAQDGALVAAPNGSLVRELTYVGDDLHSVVQQNWAYLPLFNGQVQVTLPSGSERCMADGPGIAPAACLTPANVQRVQDTWLAIAPTTWDDPPVICEDPCVPAPVKAELYLHSAQLAGTGTAPAAGDRRTSYSYDVRYGQNELLPCLPRPLPCDPLPKDDYRVQVRKTVLAVANAAQEFAVMAQSEIEYSRVGGLPVKSRTWFDAETVAETTRTFDVQTGNLLSETQPAQQSAAGGSGAHTTYGYDAHALFVQQMTNELGQRLESDYDIASGAPVASRGPNTVTVGANVFWQEQRWKRDGLGRVLARAVTVDDEAQGYTLQTVERFAYEDGSFVDAERPTRVRHEQLLAFGGDVWVTTAQTVDGLGRVLVSSQVLGSGHRVETSYSYDEQGNLAVIETPDPRDDNARVRYSYSHDSLGRLVRFVRPDGSGLALEYRGYSESRCTISDDGSGGCTKALYDLFGRLVALHELYPNEDAAITRYAYDSRDNLSQVIDADGQTTRLVYDWDGHRVEIGRGARVWRYRYDLNGNLLTKTSPAAPGAAEELHTVRYQYDDLNRVTEVRYGDVELAQRTQQELAVMQGAFQLHLPVIERATTGGVEPPLQTTPVVRSIQYVYDEGRNGLAHLSRVVLPFGELRYGYDSRGQIVREERAITLNNLPGVAPLTFTQSVSRAYNALGLLTVSRWDDGSRWRINYNNQGQVRSVNWFDPAVNDWRAVADFERTLSGLPSTRRSDYGPTRSFTYDALARPATDSVQSAEGGAIIATRAYAYTDAGDLAAVSGQTNGVDAGAVYTYDAQHRLLSAAGPQAYQGNFSYSAAGNVLGAQVTWEGSNRSRQVQYEYGAVDAHAVDQLVNVGAGDVYASFAYDLAGRMTQRSTPEGTTTLIWDSLDQLRMVHSPNGDEFYYYDHLGHRILAVSPQGGVRFWFGESETHFSLDGQQTKRYLHLMADGPTLARVADNTTVELQYADTLQNLLVALDPDGQTTASFLYGAFGEVLQASGDAAHHRRFNGKEDEAVTGLHYYGARYYDALTLRWTSADPLYQFLPELGLQEPQRMNLYGFSLNNPLRYYDPDGRDGEDREEEVEAPDTRCWWSQNPGQCELQSGLEDYDARVAQECFCERGKLSISIDLVNQPEFRTAFLLFLSTEEGKRLVESLSVAGGTHYLIGNEGDTEDPFTGLKIEGVFLGQQFTGREEGQNLGSDDTAELINVKLHLERFDSRLEILQLADTIYHELRHAEAEVLYSGDEAADVHDALDKNTYPSRDPRLAAFQREIGLTR